MYTRAILTPFKAVQATLQAETPTGTARVFEDPKP